MKAFKVKGKFLMGDRWQEFTKEAAGSDEAEAREKIYSRFGSKHRVKRTNIHISEVRAIQPSEVSDPVILYLLKNKKKEKKALQDGKKKAKKTPQVGKKKAKKSPREGKKKPKKLLKKKGQEKKGAKGE